MANEDKKMITPLKNLKKSCVVLTQGRWYNEIIRMTGIDLGEGGYLWHQRELK